MKPVGKGAKHQGFMHHKHVRKLDPQPPVSKVPGAKLKKTGATRDTRSTK